MTLMGRAVYPRMILGVVFPAMVVVMRESGKVGRERGGRIGSAKSRVSKKRESWRKKERKRVKKNATSFIVCARTRRAGGMTNRSALYKRERWTAQRRSLSLSAQWQNGKTYTHGHDGTRV